MSTFLVPTRGWGGLENTYHVKKEGMGKRGGREVSSCHPGACHGVAAFPLPRRQRGAKEGGKEGATPRPSSTHAPKRGTVMADRRGGELAGKRGRTKPTKSIVFKCHGLAGEGPGLFRGGLRRQGGMPRRPNWCPGVCSRGPPARKRRY